MDRQERVPASRIPNASGVLRTPSTRLGTTSRTPLSTLGKRGAGEAGLGDDASATRRALHASQSKQTTLERQVVELERQLRKRDEDLEEQRREIGKLKQERGILLEGETKAKDALKESEANWAVTEAEYKQIMKDFRTRVRTRESDLFELNNKYQVVKTDNARLKRESLNEIKLLEGRLKEVEEERDELKGWQRRAEGLSIGIEELRREHDANLRARDSTREEQRSNDLVLKENLVTLQTQKDELQVEVSELRKWKKEADTRDRSVEQTERELRNEIRGLNVELGRARREVESLTRTFPASGNPDEDAHALQSRLSALSKLHDDLKRQLNEQTDENTRLHSRLSTLASDSENATYTLTRDLEEATRQLRWANEGRSSAERREQLLKTELATLQTKRSPGLHSHSAESSSRVQQLEALVERYRAELDAAPRDSKDAVGRIGKGTDILDSDKLAEAEEVIKGQEEDIANLQDRIGQLTEANSALDEEVAQLMRRVFSGEFNPERERCLELRTNPAAKIHAVRTEQLENLKAENAALLTRLAEVDQEPSGTASTASAEARGLVPRISFDRLSKEKAELEAAHEKRLRRLKEIFGAKSREFLEAVYSLLGWRIRFDENGADIRLTSMYAPKGKMGLTLKFTSNEGHFGTMAMMGGMARSLEEAREFWVTERQSIPGFLAQVTTEMFEKTTLGRAAGYVGLE